MTKVNFYITSHLLSGKLFNTCSHGWLLDLGALDHLSGMLKDLFDISKAKSNLFTKKNTKTNQSKQNNAGIESRFNAQN